MPPGWTTKPVALEELAKVLESRLGSSPTLLESRPVSRVADVPAELTDDPEFPDLVRDYLDDAPRQLDTMRQALDRADAGALAAAAHALAGSSGVLRAFSVTERCRQLEELVKLGDFKHCAAHLPKVEDAVQGVVGCLQEKLAAPV